MIYVFPSGSVVYDSSSLTEEEKNNGVPADSIPSPDVVPGKYAVLKADTDTQTVFYEYVDEPKNDELEELKAHVADLFELVLMGGV